MRVGRIFLFICCCVFGAIMSVMADVENTQKTAGNDDQIEMSQEDAEIAASVMESEEDQQVVEYESFLLEMGWDNSGTEHRKEMFEKINALKEALKQNTEQLSDKAKAAAENEQSLANRTLTAVTTAATGIGGMELARGLSEQQADKEASADMTAYIATFRCEYGDGKSVKGGPDEIELPGGNNQSLMNLRNEYFALANDLKDRKNALDMKPGIESEEILDKSEIGLYDDENTGITDGAYASLYRAQMLESEKDKAAINSDQESSDKRVKYGAAAVAAGAVIGIVGNQILNRDKSEDILAKRKDIEQELSEILQFEIDDCNAKIQESKEWANEQKYTDEYKQNAGLRDWVTEIENMEFIDSLEKLKDHPICD